MDDNKNPISESTTPDNNDLNFVIEDPYAGKVSTTERHHHHHHHHSSSRHSSHKKKKHSTHKKAKKFKEPSVRFLTGWLAIVTLLCIILTAWNVELMTSINNTSNRVKALVQNGTSVADPENEEDDEYIPGYVKAEAESVIERVKALQTDSTISFIAISDTHLKLNDEISLESIKHAGQAMKLIREGLDIDFAALLGDVTWGSDITPMDIAIKEIEKVNELISDGFADIPNFRIIGNHDTLTMGYQNNSDYLDTAELYEVIGKYNEGGVYPEDQQGYFYRDLDEFKLRVICLNTSEADFDVEGAIDLDITPEQVSWFVNALDLSGKSDSSEWQHLILSHHPLYWYETYSEMVAVIDAYTLGTSGTVTLEGKDVSFDFAGKNSAKIIANIHGHLHNYKISTLGNSRIPTVTVPNASYNRNNELGTFYTYDDEIKNKYGEKTTYEKTAATSEDTAFSVITIDLEYGQIYATNYGAGYDREVGY